MRKKLTAVVIKGNPRYLGGANRAVARKFYRDVKRTLQRSGYRVSFDPGKPFTAPKAADVWVGHSRGADRLRFAPKGTKTIALGAPGYKNAVNNPLDNTAKEGIGSVKGMRPNRHHFVLTPAMRSALSGKVKTSARMSNTARAARKTKVSFLTPANMYRIKLAAEGSEEHGTGIPTMKPWFKPYPHQKQAIDKLYDNHGKMLLFHSTGTGKAQPLDALVLTPAGWATMGDMEVGRQVIDPDGGVAEVVGVYPQGEQDIYKVTFTDGSSAECTHDHLWRVYLPDDDVGVPRSVVLTLRQIIDNAGGTSVTDFYVPSFLPDAGLTVARRIVSIDKVRRAQAQCIAVNTKRNLYVTNDYVVTHNTASAVYGFEKMSHDKKSNGKAVVVVPSGLRENFASGGAEKFTVGRRVEIIGSSDEKKNAPDRYARLGEESGANYTVVSYAMFRRDPVGIMKRTGADTLILDEHHRTRNEPTQTFKAVLAARPYAKNFMGLTASPVNNSPAEVATLVSLSEGRRILTPRQFKRAFMRTVGTEKGFFGGERKVQELTNLDSLVGMLAPKTDVIAVEDLEGKTMPKKVVEEVQVPMSDKQYKLYQLALGKAGMLESFLMRRDENITLKEAEQAFVKLHQARRVANAVHTGRKDVSVAQSALQTPKVKRLLEDTQNHLDEDPKNKVVLYSNLVTGGVDVLHAGLKKMGIPHGVFTGKGTQVGDEQVTGISRQKDVQDYKAGKKRVIIISGAGAEGIDLPNTTAFHALDGHFNPERISQAEARGIRLGGQGYKPPEERKVTVRRYQSVVPESAKPGFFGRLTGRKTPRTTDQWMYSVAESKARQATQLEVALRKPHKYIRKYRAADGSWRYVYPKKSGGRSNVSPKKESWWKRTFD